MEVLNNHMPPPEFINFPSEILYLRTQAYFEMIRFALASGNYPSIHITKPQTIDFLPRQTGAFKSFHDPVRHHSYIFLDTMYQRVAETREWHTPGLDDPLPDRRTLIAREINKAIAYVSSHYLDGFREPSIIRAVGNQLPRLLRPDEMRARKLAKAPLDLIAAPRHKL